MDEYEVPGGGSRDELDLTEKGITYQQKILKQ